MEAHDEEFGPVDIAVIAYPADAPMTGEAIPLLMDLVKSGVIRVLDVMFVTKNEDGTFSGFDARDLRTRGSVTSRRSKAPRPACSATTTPQNAADAIEPGSAAVVLVYENRWAAPFIAAVRRNGGVPIAFERIPVQDVIDTLDALDAAEVAS